MSGDISCIACKRNIERQDPKLYKLSVRQCLSLTDAASFLQHGQNSNQQHFGLGKMSPFPRLSDTLFSTVLYLFRR